MKLNQMKQIKFVRLISSIVASALILTAPGLDFYQAWGQVRPIATRPVSRSVVTGSIHSQSPAYPDSYPALVSLDREPENFSSYFHGALREFLIRKERVAGKSPDSVQAFKFRGGYILGSAEDSTQRLNKSLQEGTDAEIKEYSGQVFDLGKKEENEVLEAVTQAVQAVPSLTASEIAPFESAAVETRKRAVPELFRQVMKSKLKDLKSSDPRQGLPSELAAFAVLDLRTPLPYREVESLAAVASLTSKSKEELLENFRTLFSLYMGLVRGSFLAGQVGRILQQVDQVPENKFFDSRLSYPERLLKVLTEIQEKGIPQVKARLIFHNVIKHEPVAAPLLPILGKLSAAVKHLMKVTPDRTNYNRDFYTVDFAGIVGEMRALKQGLAKSVSRPRTANGILTSLGMAVSRAQRVSYKKKFVVTERIGYDRYDRKIRRAGSRAGFISLDFLLTLTGVGAILSLPKLAASAKSSLSAIDTQRLEKVVRLTQSIYSHITGLAVLGGLLAWIAGPLFLPNYKPKPSDPFYGLAEALVLMMSGFILWGAVSIYMAGERGPKPLKDTVAVWVAEKPFWLQAALVWSFVSMLGNSKTALLFPYPFSLAWNLTWDVFAASFLLSYSAYKVLTAETNQGQQSAGRQETH